MIIAKKKFLCPDFLNCCGKDKKKAKHIFSDKMFPSVLIETNVIKEDTAESTKQQAAKEHKGESNPGSIDAWPLLKQANVAKRKLLFYEFMSSAAPPTSLPVCELPAALKLLSWNIHFTQDIMGKNRMPDIICLQEAPTSTHSTFSEAMLLAGFTQVATTKHAHLFGTVIFVRYSLRVGTVRSLASAIDPVQSRAVAIYLPKHKTLVLNVHLNSHSEESKRKEWNYLMDRFAVSFAPPSLPSKKQKRPCATTIVAGDFNSVFQPYVSSDKFSTVQSLLSRKKMPKPLFAFMNEIVTDTTPWKVMRPQFSDGEAGDVFTHWTGMTIDYILHNIHDVSTHASTGPTVTIYKTNISDHLPIVGCFYGCGNGTEVA
jgi:endonuclease/exonuclease/phosphatase family metal-dependent hydrolase